MDQNAKTARIIMFSSLKVKEEGISEEDKEMWQEIYDVTVASARLRTHIVAMCGHPDSAQACRNILAAIKEYNA